MPLGRGPQRIRSVTRGQPADDSPLGRPYIINKCAKVDVTERWDPRHRIRRTSTQGTGGPRAAKSVGGADPGLLDARQADGQPAEADRSNRDKPMLDCQTPMATHAWRKLQSKWRTVF
jgi:hypothetical protein